jgi:hypothetical protein
MQVQVLFTSKHFIRGWKGKNISQGMNKVYRVKSNSQITIFFTKVITRILSLFHSYLGLETSQVEPGSARLGEAQWNSEPSQARLGHFANSIMRLVSARYRLASQLGSQACTLKYSTTVIIVISSNLKHNMFHIIKNYVPALYVLVSCDQNNTLVTGSR